LAAAWLDGQLNQSGKINFFPVWNRFSLGLLLLILILGILQIRLGIVDFRKFGVIDPSLEMYGWKQFEKKFIPFLKEDIESGKMNADAVIISAKWFPAAHLDYYVAYPNKIRLFAVNSLEEIHKYAWINKIRGGIKTGMDAYFITPDRYSRNPASLYKDMFETIEPPDTIPLYRGEKRIEEFYIYRMKNLKATRGF
jgi:hypothetical protein